MSPAERRDPFACLVLAAGAGARFGGPKALAKLPSGERFLDAVVRTALAAGADPVVAVVAPGVTPEPPAAWVENPAARGEQIVSVRLGLVRLRESSVLGTLLWPVDHPFVGVESVLAVVDGFRRTRAGIVIPTRDGRRGHPSFFARTLWDALDGAVEGGARAVIQQHASQVLEVPVPDAGVLRDIDTQDDMP